MQDQDKFFSQIHWTCYARSMKRIHKSRDYKRRQIALVNRVHAEPIARLIPLQVRWSEIPNPESFKTDIESPPVFSCITNIWQSN